MTDLAPGELIHFKLGALGYLLVYQLRSSVDDIFKLRSDMTEFVISSQIEETVGETGLTRVWRQPKLHPPEDIFSTFAENHDAVRGVFSMINRIIGNRRHGQDILEACLARDGIGGCQPLQDTRKHLHRPCFLVYSRDGSARFIDEDYENFRRMTESARIDDFSILDKIHDVYLQEPSAHARMRLQSKSTRLRDIRSSLPAFFVAPDTL